ncbi:MAG TPA: Clp protease N-terminal domain-containing protein [Fimbriimonas sp.]|nr:Clp protease N-terminal domain-containing protein [Fimbriimonas sp.]
MWSRFTEYARKVIYSAHEEALRWGQEYISSEHILLGLTNVEGNVGLQILERLGTSGEKIRPEIEKHLPKPKSQVRRSDFTLTPRAKRIIDLAYETVEKLGNNYLGTEHLLLGMIIEGDGIAGRVLCRCGIEFKAAVQAALDLQEEAAEEAKKHTEIRKAIDPPLSYDPWEAYADSAKRAILGAQEEKSRNGQRRICAEHLLLALIGDPACATALLRLGVTAEQLREEIKRSLKSP